MYQVILIIPTNITRMHRYGVGNQSAEVNTIATMSNTMPLVAHGKILPGSGNRERNNLEQVPSARKPLLYAGITGSIIITGTGFWVI